MMSDGGTVDPFGDYMIFAHGGNTILLLTEFLFIEYNSFKKINKFKLLFS